MTKTPGVLQRVCQIAFLPALICVVSVLVLFIPVIGGIAAAIGFLAACIASVCGSGFGIEWGRDLSLKVDDGMDRPLMRSTSFGLGVFSSVISVVLEVIAAIPVIGVVLSLVEGVVIGAAGSYSYYGSYALEAALFGSLGLLVLALIASAILGVFFKMFADIAVMHFAVTGRVESAFSLDKVWAAFKHNKTKLFCASFLPEFLTGLVSNAITWILTAVFGAIASGAYGLLLSPHGYRGDCYRRWCHARIVPGADCIRHGVPYGLWQDAQAPCRWLLGCTLCKRVGRRGQGRRFDFLCSRVRRSLLLRDSIPRQPLVLRLPRRPRLPCPGTCSCPRTGVRGDACGARLGCRCHAGG